MEKMCKPRNQKENMKQFRAKNCKMEDLSMFMDFIKSKETSQITNTVNNSTFCSVIQK